jgi:hypothetical protein
MSFIEITAVLGNLGEFVGAIAVVVTLFHVGLQVKHSKESLKPIPDHWRIALVGAYHARPAECYIERY